MQISNNHIGLQSYKSEPLKLESVKIEDVKPVEMSKVELIKQQLEDNTYKINLNKTAEKLAQALI